MLDMQAQIEHLMEYVRADMAPSGDVAARGKGEALVRAASEPAGARRPLLSVNPAGKDTRFMADERTHAGGAQKDAPVAVPDELAILPFAIPCCFPNPFFRWRPVARPR
jgi:hypothetical protein